MLISRGSKLLVASCSSLLFSASMYACISESDRCSSLPLSWVRKHNGAMQLGLYCMCRAIGRRVFVPPPTFTDHQLFNKYNVFDNFITEMNY